MARVILGRWVYTTSSIVLYVNAVCPVTIGEITVPQKRIRKYVYKDYYYPNSSYADEMEHLTHAGTCVLLHYHLLVLIQTQLIALNYSGKLPFAKAIYP